MTTKANRYVTGIVAGVLLVCGVGVNAGQPMNISYTYSAPSEGDLEDDVQQGEFKIDTSWKVLDEEDDGYDFSIGIAYQYNGWSFDDNRIDDIDLHKIEVPLRVGFKADDNILVNAGLTPGIHSDWENVDSDDFRLDAMAVGTYVESSTLQYILGVGFGEEFGDVSAHPIVGVRWQATEDIFVDAVFPKPRVTYMHSPDLNLFVAGEPTGGEWNVGKQDDSDEDVNVQIKGFRVGVGAEYQVTEGGWLFAMVGSEGNRELQASVDDDEVFDDDIDLDDCMFVQIGFCLK